MDYLLKGVRAKLRVGFVDARAGIRFIHTNEFLSVRAWITNLTAALVSEI